MSGKNILKESFVKVRGFVFGFVLSVVLVAGAVFAAGGAQNMQNKWDAFWHGTSWIQAGKVVESEKIAENFEWLKQQVDDLQSQVDNFEPPANYTLIGNSYYISPEKSAKTFLDAVKACDADGAEICSIAQWARACMKLSGSDSSWSNGWEWIADGGDSGYMKVVQDYGTATKCSYMADSSVASSRNFRCCISK